MRSATCLFALSLITGTGQGAQEFYPDDPLVKEPPPRDASQAVARKVSDYYDFFHQTFGHPGERSKTGKETVPAQAVNTLGEPMDGAWYTKRHYYQRMSIQELVRGPGNSNAPATDGRWEIVKAKSEGVTPGFEIVDSQGRRYLLKFDPPEQPELATGPDVVVSRFFYALGYHVPENYIVHFPATQLELPRGVVFTDAKGRKRPMEESDLASLLARVPRGSDGQYRACASLYLTGKPLGPFKYFGTRRDDPNDTVRHEHRRDLRGLRVFAAWLGHDDSRAINSLDTLVADGGAPYLRHHLIDFGSTLGSASYGPNSPRSGFEYLFQWKPAIRQFLTAGLLPPDWAKAHYTDNPGLGRLEAEKFDPAKWRPEYPNPAFLNMLPEDAFWAAKQVMAFSDDEIRAIVKTGEYSDPAVEAAISDALIRRRDKIGNAFFAGVLPLDRFAVHDGRLVFDDLEIRHGRKTSRSYTFQWFELNEGRRSALPGAVSAQVPAVPATFLVCEIAGDQPGPTIHVYLRGAREVAGLSRQ